MRKLFKRALSTQSNFIKKSITFSTYLKVRIAQNCIDQKYQVSFSAMYFSVYLEQIEIYISLIPLYRILRER
jgi:hypothetical protein